MFAKRDLYYFDIATRPAHGLCRQRLLELGRRLIHGAIRLQPLESFLLVTSFLPHKTGTQATLLFL